MRWIFAVIAVSMLVGSLFAGNGDEPQANRPALEPSDNAVSVLEHRGSIKPLMTDSGLKGWTAPGFVYPQTPAISKKGVVVVCKKYHVEGYEARTARRRWRRKLKDNDPTSPTIHGDIASVATESCTIYAINVNTGGLRWSRWLAGHLQTQVSGYENMLITTAPSVKFKGRHIPNALVGMVGSKVSWAVSLSSEALSAPVVSDGFVYVSCTDGTLWCHATDGSFCWKRKYGVTCAPWVDGDCLYVTIPEKDEFEQPYEAVVKLECSDGTRGETVARQPAGHMEDFDEKRGKIATTSPGSGVLWSYQGSRPCVVDGRLYTSVGEEVTCYDVESMKPEWSTSYEDIRTERKRDPMSTTPAPPAAPAAPAAPAVKPKKDKEVAKAEAQATGKIEQENVLFFTSPAVTNGHVYVGTKMGDLYCLDAATGEVLFSLKFPCPILRQPAVRCGYLCIVSPAGQLYCIKLDKDYKKDTWYQWGGSSSSNGYTPPSEDK